MIDIDVEFERKLYKKLRVLKPLTKAGVFEMLLRLNKESTKIGDFARKYRMHTDTLYQAVKILQQFDLITVEKVSRMKILSITDLGKQVVKYLNEINSLLKKREEYTD